MEDHIISTNRDFTFESESGPKAKTRCLHNVTTEYPHDDLPYHSWYVRNGGTCAKEKSRPLASEDHFAI